MHISLKYGTRTDDFDLPQQANVLRIKEPEKTITPDLFRERLMETLTHLHPDLSDTALVIADKTRLCGYPEYLPVLLQSLVDAGASPDRIRIYIAYGTHARQSDAESRKIYGTPWETRQFIHHDCTDESIFVRLGRTSRNTPIMFRKEIVEATCRITFGAISHHYFAGYGGGRKLIFPGLGFRDAIYHNHGLFLDRESGDLALGCDPGVLDGNPLAEDLAEVEAFCPAHLAIHGILDSRGEVCDLRVGSGADHFRSACAAHGANCELTHDRQYDLVLASCGGFPKDLNFIQSHKALHHAAKFVRDGGRLILLAECRDGVGSQTFLPWFEKESREAAFRELADNYSGNGGTALSMMAKTGRIRVSLCTELPKEICDLIGVEKTSLDAARAMIDGCAESLAVIPNAALLVKTPTHR